MNSLYESKLNLPLIHKGKVRDMYKINDDKLLIVTTDRLSAFDVILDEPINQKGSVLTAVSNFWFAKTKHIIANHLLNDDLSSVLSEDEIAQVKNRAIIVKKLKPLPVEAIVRGYLIGSGWKDYQNTGKVCGIELVENLQLAQQLPEAIYTPSSKAEVGEHDENITFEQTIELLGEDLANQVKTVSLKLYNFAAEYALKKGIIIADTKFEFGLDEDNKLVIMDEVLTPDSSRFWAKDKYKIGSSPESFDKQIVRDYLETCDWDKTHPAPQLPLEISERTTQKYLEVQNILCD
ncbi:Phosphoribosylaminoimidazole-succinocarboxamide synthase [hydrothermal vent metagenome]|uniref:phosphoribosylaminoimidazolesuccinocarboxamide synthase n=1 Tax=hydrothermal vent metagenome TaxID=652676 RepID=A0A1W1CVX5_9ZZZZ